MRPDGADALVLEVDMCRCVQRALQPVGPDERCGAPVLVEVAHLFRDLDPCICRVQLLLRQAAGEERVEVFALQWLLCARVQHRLRFGGHVSHDVVPCCGNILLLQ